MQYYSFRDAAQPGRALAWGLRKEKLPAEVFRTKGEVLLFCKPAAAARRKSYKTSDRSGVVERFVRETYEARQEVGDGLHLSKKHIILGFIFGT